MKLLGFRDTQKILLSKNPITSYRKLQQHKMAKRTKRVVSIPGKSGGRRRRRRRIAKRRIPKPPVAHRSNKTRRPGRRRGRAINGGGGVGRRRAKSQRSGTINRVVRRRRFTVQPNELKTLYKNQLR